MNAKIFTPFVLAVALAVVFGFGAVNNTHAVSTDSYNVSTPDQSNMIGVDEAGNRLGATSDRDKGPAPSFQTYGLFGNWSDVR